MERSHEVTDEHVPSFFQNSCPGISATELQKEEAYTEKGDGCATRPINIANEEGRRGGKIVGGFTCCVPDCFSNSKRNPELSFYNLPNGKSKERQELRKKWLHMISRKDFKDPGLGHRVCSKHLVGGQKTYMNNIPTIVPKTKNRKEQKERATKKSRNREFVPKLQSEEPINQNGTLSQAEVQDSIEQDQQWNGLNVEDEVSQRISELELEADSEGNQQQASMKSEKDNLTARILELERENVRLKDEVQRLTEVDSRQKNSFSLDDVKSNPKAFRFYTGFTNYETFKLIFDSFGPAVNNLIYHGTNANPANINSPEYVKRGPKRTLTAEQEFFYVLVRLRLGLLEEDISFRAGISCSQFSRIWITWLDFLHSKFRTYPIWPSKAAIMKTMPNSFKETYPTTRVIIDCTEIYIEKPSSVRSQAATYSNYKHYNTAKGLIGITPAGAVSYVSDLFTGRTSDKKATSECGIYQLLEGGDSVMADKGFDIEEELPTGVRLNIPPFLRGKEHLSIKEEVETRQIAAVRIHVERAISRIKTFRILKSVFPINMGSELNKIWVICSYLTNFLPPLIVENNA